MSRRYCLLGRLAILVLAIVVACATQRPITKLEIDHTLARADTLLGRDQPDSAARLINELVRSVPADTFLLWRQAEVNTQLESVEGRRKAARALRKLSEASPRDPKYHLCLAKVLIDQTRNGDARKELYRAIELAPADEEPSIILADQYLKPFFSKEDEDFADSAEYVLKRLAAANPQALAGLSKLGGIEAVRLKIDSARTHLNAVLKIDSAHVAANLAMGYVCYQSKDFGGAASSFDRALARMDSTQSAGYRSIEYLIPPTSIRFYRKMTAHERDSLERKYWSMADLDPTTSLNERQVEHCARVWEANLSYSDPKNERVGWRTDMGETLIRLGRPDEKVRVRVGGAIADVSLVWYWQYRTVAYPCTLAFVDQMQSGNYNFPFPNRDNTGTARTNASKQLAYLNYMLKPEESTVSRIQKPIEIASDIYQFRGDSEATAVVSYLTIVAKDKLLDLRKNDGIAIRQATHDSVLAAVSSGWSGERAAPQGKDTALSKTSFQHRSGTFQLSTVAEMSAENGFGLRKDTLSFRAYPKDTLNVSDLVLSADSVREPSLGVFWHRDQSSVPRPSHVFSGQKLVYLYFEIYNLPTDVYRQTSYEISYTLQLVKPTESGLRSLVSKVLPGKRESITTTMHEVGMNRDLARVLALDVGELREGSYTLTLKLTDLIFNRSVVRTSSLMLKS
jgi:GWxTD domain-containing protein